MKKILLLLLIALPIYIAFSLYFLDKDYFLCPIEYRGGIIIRNDSMGDGHFGAARSGNRVHNGIDLLADVGTPVLASRSGKVLAARSARGMGNYILIAHPENLTTLYGHLSAIYVKEGDYVRQGDFIGRVGKTGNANYNAMLAHLHFEVKKDGLPQDPMGYLE